MTMQRWNNVHLAIFLCSAVFCTIAFAGSDQNMVAMVTDMKGSISGSKIGILDTLPSESRLKLSRGNSVTLVYLTSGKEYTIQGPAIVIIKDEKPILHSGSVIREHQLLGKQNKIRLKPIGLSYAMVTMRASGQVQLELLSLNGSKSLTTNLVFRWQTNPVRPGLEYRFELADIDDNKIIDTTVNTTTFSLPENITLKANAAYIWKITMNISGRKISKDAEFSTLDLNQSALVERLAPANGAPFSERVVYATLLRQLNLDDEAREYWKTLARERPDNSKLHKMAGGR